jgi:four helix bundle protein
VANIVEGYAFRKHRAKRYINHLEISIGSCDETRLWLRYSLDLGYIEKDVYNRLIAEYEEIGKMLWGLLQSVKKQSSQPE